ncbi:MAG: TetR/AcrR family transcriptional regulator [Rhodococcus sp. (in: high G+C Gram-positive bacteria)]
MSNINRPHIGRPTGSTARTTQARAVRTRESIVSVAAHHFDADGYGATSINAILASGKFTKGAIYHHFLTKEAIAHQLIADWNRAVNESISEAIGTGRPAVDQLTAIFTALGDRIAAGTNLRAGMKLTLEPTIDNGAAFAHWVDTLSDIVDTAIADGELPDTPAAHRLAWNLCAGTVGAAHASVILREDVGLGDRVHDVVSAHLAAFPERTPGEPRLSS